MGRISVRVITYAIAATLSVAGLPPLHSLISFEPITSPGTTLRHCDYVTSTCPPETGNEDFIFLLVPALNKAPSPFFSVQSTNHPGTKLSQWTFVCVCAFDVVRTLQTTDLMPSPEGTTLLPGASSVPTSTQYDSATWQFLPGLKNASLWSLRVSKNVCISLGGDVSVRLLECSHEHVPCIFYI